MKNNHWFSETHYSAGTAAHMMHSSWFVPAHVRCALAWLVTVSMQLTVFSLRPARLGTCTVYARQRRTNEDIPSPFLQ